MKGICMLMITALLALCAGCSAPQPAAPSATASPPQETAASEAPSSSVPSSSGPDASDPLREPVRGVSPADQFVQDLNRAFGDNGVIIYATGSAYDEAARCTTVVIDGSIRIQLYAEDRDSPLQEVVVLGTLPLTPAEQQDFQGTYALCAGAVVYVLDGTRTLAESILVYADLTNHLGGEDIARTSSNGIDYALFSDGYEIAFAIALPEPEDADMDEAVQPMD